MIIGRDVDARQVQQKRGLFQGLAKTKSTWFGRVGQLLGQSTIDAAFWNELEEALVGADVGLDLTESIISGAKDRVRKEGLLRPDQARAALKTEMLGLMQKERPPQIFETAASSPIVVLVVGVNGSGKTTTIAKLAKTQLQKRRRLLLVAGDTFRAAAIDQLRVWGDRLGVEVVAHQPGADPSAVVFDGVQAARSRNSDIVMVDTAGRLQTKSNLMEELRKVRRSIDKAQPGTPVRTLLVLDATTGQNGLSQAREFLKAVGVDALVLTKLDGTAKGGVTLAIYRELSVPIAYVGTGESADDLAEFDPPAFVEALLD